MKRCQHQMTVCAAVLLAVAACLGSIPATAQTLTTIWSFSLNNDNGDNPLAPTVFDSSGAAYGSVAIGAGISANGAVYELIPPAKVGGSWTEAVLYRLAGGSDGQQPGDVVFGQNRVLYSTSYLGGIFNCLQGCGTIFELTPPAKGGDSWNHNVLYDFLGGEDGQAPGNVVVGQGGALFGATPSGGPPFGNNCKVVGCGTVFALTPPGTQGGSWSKTILYDFPATATDGRSPNADVVFDSKGNLYGTTYYGGTAFYGTVFELTPPTEAGGAWTETVLHNFSGKSSDGGYPIGGLTIGSNGAIYGTASYSGAANNSGTAFELTPPTQAGGTWTYTVLHTFAGGKDGATPATTMAFDQKGNLYGTTWNGGSTACNLGCGTVFKLAPAKSGGAWTETILHNWPSSGQNPNASIVVFRNGLLYGTTSYFGVSNVGSVFTLVP